MNKKRLFSAVFVALSLMVRAGTTNGTFRFLTQSLPNGTTATQYTARFVTANADGTVTFSISNSAALPQGLSLDPQSGFLTGIPTHTFSGTLTVVADDTTQLITNFIRLQVSSAGGGGSGGASFVNTNLAVGQMGTVYADQLVITNSVSTNLVFEAEDLPPGISLNGQTGALSGNPVAAGRYFVTFSAYDAVAAANSSVVLPILVLPKDTNFQFVTENLNNGEVGTPFFDEYLVTNAPGNVTFAASGLPPGLTVDRTNGIVSGTPTNAGTFQVLISAASGHDTISCNMSMIIVPTSTSDLYWNIFSIPPGLLGITYNETPTPVSVATVNGVSVTYSVTGLPPGLSYNTTTGDLTGTPTEVGEFNTVFTAIDSLTNVLTYGVDFVILPATGGDISSVPINLWLTTEKLTVGVVSNESWAGTLLFNADRTTGMRFDPATNDLSLSLGSRTLDFPPGTLAGTNSISFTSPSGTIPSESLKLSLSKQTLQWKTSKDNIAATVPGLYEVALSMGSQYYRTAVQFGSTGSATAFSALRPCFVLQTGSLKVVTNNAASTATLGMLLSDASFVYQTNDTLRIRLLQGTNALVDRDFTTLGQVQTSTNRIGKIVFAVHTLTDPATTNKITRFSYSSATGKLSLDLSGLDLSQLSDSEAQVGVELTVGTRIYPTGVTFFGSNPGSYSTVMP